MCNRMYRTHICASACGRKLIYICIYVCTMPALRNEKKVMQPPLCGVGMSPGHTGCAWLVGTTLTRASVKQ